MQNKIHNDEKITQNLAKMKHKIFVLSGKGGVGKSTVAAHLGLALAEKKYKVGILDSDIHGPSIPKILGIENKKPDISEQGITPITVLPNLKVMSMSFFLPDSDSPVIWRGPVKMGAIKQFISNVHWGDLDYLIVDLPPGTGDEALSIAQLIPDNDGAIIVTTPQDVAILSVRKSINFVKKMNLPIIGIIENMSGFTCPHCNKNIDIFKTGGGYKAAMDFMIPFLGKIPLDPNIVERGDAGDTKLHHSNTTVNKSFEDIVENIEKIVQKIKR
ncbi:MAG TPA: Mrp/NBP35 family ATP-binding protein [Candidatus Thermoplasmatota archaeon]|nr:Mrp/NBP35 family ATP-binding protein [Candidatus Thermoplasmatota archaeon]